MKKCYLCHIEKLTFGHIDKPTESSIRDLADPIVQLAEGTGMVIDNHSVRFEKKNATLFYDLCIDTNGQMGWILHSNVKPFFNNMNW